MSLVKVGDKYQATLPAAVRNQIGIAVGDILEAKVERGKIPLTPETVKNRNIARSTRTIVVSFTAPSRFINRPYQSNESGSEAPRIRRTVAVQPQKIA